jgi:signal transduction histidine kinase
MADRDQLGQVVMNLVRNAAEASRDSLGSIVIGARELGDSLVEVSITDAGRGVDPELLDKIYDPYFTTKSYGLGVGLALCRSMVERHGGTLVLENITGGGAVARIRLPAAP